MIVHLIDGTYELFRQYYGLRRDRTRGRSAKGSAPTAAAEPSDSVDPPLDAVRGVLHFVVRMLEGGATHLGVATDHVIESFRNDLWPGYKTGAGVEPELRAQFEPLEEALAAMGVTVWAMVELEADDALASAARLASADPRVDKVSIWTPDKDLGQSVRGDRVVQVESRTGTIRDTAAVRRKFGVEPRLIPDYLALVGDSADGYPGIRGIGPKTAAALLNRHGPIEEFPPDVLGERRDDALLFKNLATLRDEAPLFADVAELEWRGPSDEFEAWAVRVADSGLLQRCRTIRQRGGAGRS